MQTRTRLLAWVALAVALLCAPAGVWAQTSQPERWLHVRVDSVDGKGELVRVNMPLDLAAKLLPAVQNEKMRNGRVVINEAQVNGVDLRAVLDAMRTTRDGEFVTVQSNDADVQVVKKAGFLHVNVHEKRNTRQKRVEIKVPMTVVEALLSGPRNELDLVAAIRALERHGESELVFVKDERNTVRVWVDSKNTSE